MAEKVETFELPKDVKCVPGKPCVAPNEGCYFEHEGLCAKDEIELVW